MNRKLTLLAVFALIAMTAPASAAGWIGFGNHEPSTSYDRDGGWMFAEPHTGPEEAVYFNAFETHQVATSFNPNVGTTDTRVQPFPVLEFDAMFGLWKDCNGDGYVGLAESAVLEYRSELLLDTTICAPGTAHNDGQWVYEYLVFAQQDPCVWTSETTREDPDHPCFDFFGEPTLVPGVIYVNGTKVWGDSQRPDALGGGGGGTCAVTPIPEGTTSSTGMAMRYADCLTGVLGRINAVLEIVDPEDTTGLRFENRENPQEDDHVLNRGLPVNLYGNPVAGQDGQTGLIEEGSESPAYTYDCTGQQSVTDPTGGSLRKVGVSDPTGLTPSAIGDPTGGPEDEIELKDDEGNFVTLELTDDDGVIFAVGIAVPSVNDPSGSYSDGANRTYDAVYMPAFGRDGDCEASSEDRVPVDNEKGLLDSPSSEGTAQAAGRQQADWTFQWGGIGGILFDVFGPPGGGITGISGADSAVSTTLGPRAPADGGATAMRWWTGATWYSTPNLITVAPGTGVRTDLEPAEPDYYSFYAKVDTETMAILGANLPAGSVHGIYGATQCGGTPGPGQPVSNGFDCDPANWWKSANGGDIAERYANGDEYTARVGETYHLLDVDCHDNHVAGGVRAGGFAACD